MPNNDDELFNKLREQEEQQQKLAREALEFFILKYSPADNDTADTFFTSEEITRAVAEHTGVTLNRTGLYETMLNMGYKFDARNGLDFYWLLKKE
jgi:hypothetical protein